MEQHGLSGPGLAPVVFVWLVPRFATAMVLGTVGQQLGSTVAVYVALMADCSPSLNAKLEELASYRKRRRFVFGMRCFDFPILLIQQFFQ